MSLEISVRQRDSITILDLKGQVMAGKESDALGDRLQELAALEKPKIVLNLAGVAKMDTSGISSVVRAFVSIDRKGGKLVLLNVRGYVRLVLDMTRLLRVLPTEVSSTPSKPMKNMNPSFANTLPLPASTLSSNSISETHYKLFPL